MATTDSLTGLRNRRKFDATMESEWRRAMRYGAPVSLLMIDADHFKTFNDTTAIRPATRCWSASPSAFRIRCGGPAIARRAMAARNSRCCCPGNRPSEALAVAETIRRKVEQWSEDPAVTTVSIGVASVDAGGTDGLARAGQAADKALYAAKAGGRNSCVMASVPPLSLVA